MSKVVIKAKKIKGVVQHTMAKVPHERGACVSILITGSLHNLPLVFFDDLE